MSKISELAVELVDLDNKIKALSDEVDGLKVERESTQKLLLAEMQEQDLSEFSVDAIGKRFAMKEDLFANCLVADKPKLIDALMENGFGDIVKTDVNAKSLTSLIKELTSNGKEELPEYLKDIVTLYAKPKVSITKKG